MHLFERQLLNETPAGLNIDQCEIFLQNIWENRFSFGLEDEGRYKFKRDTQQKFLFFNRKGLRAGKYAGVIKTKNETVNIYPKIFQSDKNHLIAGKDPDFSAYVFSYSVVDVLFRKNTFA